MTPIRSNKKHRNFLKEIPSLLLLPAITIFITVACATNGAKPTEAELPTYSKKEILGDLKEIQTAESELKKNGIEFEAVEQNAYGLQEVYFKRKGNPIAGSETRIRIRRARLLEYITSIEQYLSKYGREFYQKGDTDMVYSINDHLKKESQAKLFVANRTLTVIDNYIQ